MRYKVSRFSFAVEPAEIVEGSALCQRVCAWLAVFISAIGGIGYVALVMQGVVS